jgi:GNAT superfamily N-acetyltransferase
MTDPRIAPVEDNLDAYFAALVGSGYFRTGNEPDVTTLWSDWAFPLFNVIGVARFAPGTVDARAREVVAPYVARGLPFLWWPTPSGHTEELAPVLTDLGFLTLPATGMYRELDRRVAVEVPAGVTVAEVTAEELVPVMIAAFELPDFVHDGLFCFLDAPDDAHAINLVASTAEGPVGCGAAWLTGTTAGLYNIATYEASRGRGIGTALTASLLERARERGCDHAILHSSEIGRPVYERLGFVEVCQIPQFVWMPPEDEPDPV